MDWLVYAGRGSLVLSIGQKPGDVEHLLGSPNSIVLKFKGHYYYLYHKLGVQVDFGSPNGTAQVLFFYRGAVEGYSQSPAETAEALGPGVRKARMTEALGPPDKSGGG